MPQAIPPLDEDPFFEDAISDLDAAESIRRIVVLTDSLMRFATNAQVDDDRRQLARRQLQAALERELLKSRGRQEH